MLEEAGVEEGCWWRPEECRALSVLAFLQWFSSVYLESHCGGKLRLRERESRRLNWRYTAMSPPIGNHKTINTGQTITMISWSVNYWHMIFMAFIDITFVCVCQSGVEICTLIIVNDVAVIGNKVNRSPFEKSKSQSSRESTKKVRQIIHVILCEIDLWQNMLFHGNY